MGRAPCCDKANVKKGPWSPEEDSKLKDYIEKHGTGGNWIALPQKVGLKRCGKSCRLRWLNYLRPNIKHGEFSDEEDRMICALYASIGSRWSIIAAQLPGRTDNDIKNYWNTKLKKKLMGIMLPSSNQRGNKPQPTNYPPSLLQASQSLIPSLPSLSSLDYKDCPSYFNPTNKLLSAFSGFGSTPIPPNLVNHNVYNNCNYIPCLETNCSPLLQTQVSLFNPNPMQCYNSNGYPQQVKEKILMFGGDQASCSSSDGSCNHGREIKQEEMGFYMPTGGFEENPNKFMLEYGKSGGYFGNSGTTNTTVVTNNGLEYGTLEEVKQLISSNDGNDGLFFNEENKTQDQRSMYYY